MKKTRFICVMLILIIAFCAGCGKEQGTSSDDNAEQSTHNEHDGHDH